jgi:hypothetical protein
VKTSRSGMYNAQLMLPFRAPPDISKYVAKELRSAAAQYAADDEATELCHAPGSRETTLISGSGVSSDIAVQNAKEGASGGKKRRKQRLQGVVAVAYDDGGNNKEACGSDVARIMIVVGSSECQARPHTCHFEILLEEAFPNHAYPVKRKLRDCGMMKNFMVSGSLT